MLQIIFFIHFIYDFYISIFYVSDKSVQIPKTHKEKLPYRSGVCSAKVENVSECKIFHTFSLFKNI